MPFSYSTLFLARPLTTPTQDIIEADHALKIVCLGALCCKYTGGRSVLPVANFVVTILQSWTIFLTESSRNIFVKDPPNKFIKQFSSPERICFVFSFERICFVEQLEVQNELTRTGAH